MSINDSSIYDVLDFEEDNNDDESHCCDCSTLSDRAGQTNWNLKEIMIKSLFILIFVFLVIVSCLYYLLDLERSWSYVSFPLDLRLPKHCPPVQPHPSLPDCPIPPPGLLGRSNLNLTDLSWEEVEQELSATELQCGGQFSPSCNASQRGQVTVRERLIIVMSAVAIIIPYRDRESHLRVLLRHLHPILMRQNIFYRIFLTSQDDDLKFNRAMLFNVGYNEAMKLAQWDCLGQPHYHY